MQLPYADRLTIEIVPDQDAELVRLQSGQIDFTQQPLRAADIETLRPLAEQGKVQIHELGVSLEADSLPLQPPAGEVGQGPARQLDHAKGVPAGDLARRRSRRPSPTPSSWAKRCPFTGRSHRATAAGSGRAIRATSSRATRRRHSCASIGLTQRDEDEWLEDAQGNDARFTVLTFRGNSVLERGAAVVRDDLRQVGIAMDVVPLETNSVQQRVLGGDFETAFIQFTFSDPDPAMSKDFWLSTGSAHFWNPAQPTPATDWEREIDELMAKQSSTDDKGERQRLFNEVQRIFAENLPILYFAAPRVLHRRQRAADQPDRRR